MTLEPRPAAVPFDPGSGELPPPLESLFTDPEHQTLLLVAAEADDAAARTALGLARARAGRGLATVLADADLDAPRLHGLLDVPNLEGLVDLFLFGASLRRVMVRPAGAEFDFVPAGAYAPDPAEVLQSARWERIAEELGSEEALLIVFVPAAAPGARELSRRVGRAVLLGESDRIERAAARLDPGCQVLGVVEAPAAVTVASAEADDASDQPTGIAAPVREPVLQLPGSPELTEPVVIREPRKRRRVSPALIAALLLALAAGAWFGYQELFGHAPAAPVSPVAEAPVPTPRGAPVETAVPYSVAVEAHQDLETAAARLAQLRRAGGSIGFQLAPVYVRGDLYFRILAGPVADRESATALMQRLVEAGHKSGMDEWALLSTAHAFHLGDFETRDEADARVEALAAAGIPAYVVPQRYESGAYRYRVYGGAYQNEAEAEVMREMLENAGEPADLIPRVGEPIA